MKHGFWIRNTSEMTPAQALELARAADAGRWDGVFVSDAVAEDHTEPFTMLAAMAAATDDVVLGTWVTPLVARDVVTVARSSAVIDQISGGRLLLGVGLGNSVEHRALGVDTVGRELGERYDAALDVLGRLLAGESVTRHDGWFDLEDVALNVACVQQPRPAVLCGASWPHRSPFRRAARWDGVMPSWAGLGEGDDPDAPEGSRAAELRELVAFYRESGGVGEIVAPAMSGFGGDYTALCAELGVTWLLWCDQLTADDLRAGPPG